MMKGFQPSFKIEHRVAERRPRDRFQARFFEIGHRVVPEFPLESMMGKLLQMIMRQILSHSLQPLHYEPVEKCTTLVEQGPIGDLSRKRVFEGIFHFWKKVCFKEEFSGLEMRNIAAKVIF